MDEVVTDITPQDGTGPNGTIWWNVYVKLCHRWNRELSGEEAAQYRSFLSMHGMGDEEIKSAAVALWATARFFPRPVDFLLYRRRNAWAKAVEAATTFLPPMDSGTWTELEDELTRQTIHELGGISSLKRAIGRDAIATRRSFMEVYELRASMVDPWSIL